ncbi:hypothetical protein MRBBS_0573 [Marinobacter sp. BSs20148]|nr:hypothetical protein MRBBS_0573 [Marinobacter sp. BSs20148]
MKSVAAIAAMSKNKESNGLRRFCTRLLWIAMVCPCPGINLGP